MCERLESTKSTMCEIPVRKNFNIDDLKLLRERMHLLTNADSSQYHNDYSLRRYLRAFKTVHNAFQAILKTNKWRAEYGIAVLQQNKAAIEKYSDRARVLRHRDIVGRPILYFSAKHHNMIDKNTDELIRYIVYCMEEACKKCLEKIIDNICVVFDLNQLKLPCLDYQVIDQVNAILSNYYPERLGVCLIINAPSFFSGCWAEIKEGLDEYTVGKVVFLTSEKELSYYLIPDVLPTQKHITGCIPNSYNKDRDNNGLQQYDWYVGSMSRERAEALLEIEAVHGCFLVRKSSQKGMYTLSLYTTAVEKKTKHYQIKTSSLGVFYLADKHSYSSIPELINYHYHNSGGLCCRLKATLSNKPAPAQERTQDEAPTDAGHLLEDNWEIDPTELVLMEDLGTGQFGIVRRGLWRRNIDVAIKIMKPGTMSEDDFIKEAKVMTKLKHDNLVKLHGVCSMKCPIYIVTEYMRNGSLLMYLRQTTADQIGQATLLDMALQVCKGMAYLDKHNYIHRDLAARNCLVGEDNVVKVADFGLARYVLDDQYTSSGGTKFPLRWAAPEVITYMRYSSKSDVWAFGVLMWEIFTCGAFPYGRMKNPEVFTIIQQGKVLGKPKGCLNEVYNVMRCCWRKMPEDRLTFQGLVEQFEVVEESILAAAVEATFPKRITFSNSVPYEPLMNIPIDSKDFTKSKEDFL